MTEGTTCNVVNQAIADPSTVGLASFGIGLFTLSFENAGMLGANSMSVIAPLAITVGIVHFFASIMGFKKNELFTALVFGIYGLFWFAFGLINLFVAAGIVTLNAKALMILLIAYTIFTGIIFITTFKTNVAVMMTLACLLAVFLCLDFGLAAVLAGKQTQLIIIAGYLGMLDALLAFYLSAAGIIGEMFGRAVLPVGPMA